MFSEFFLWVHSYNPTLRSDMNTDIIIDLGIFCKMYQVHQLLNQASDALQDIFRRSSTAITPEIITKIYENTPDGSILQDLFSLRFAMTFEPSRTGFESRHRDNYQRWKETFQSFPNFGRDYFKHCLLGDIKLNYFGTCRFHDHSNICGWTRQEPYERRPCPYRNDA